MFVYVGGVQFPDVPEVYTDTSNVPTNRPADNTAGTNTLDNPDWSNPIANDRMNLANSFYWNAEQFAQLSSSFLSAVNSSGPGAAGTFDLLATNDYANGRMRHYNQNNSNGQGRTLSVERQPSPNGIMPGKMIWYDYPGKPDYNVEGTSAFPSMKILVLPDGTETYTIYQTDQFGNWTNVISTYSSNGTVLTRTNTYLYATNGIDMVESIGPDRVTTNCYGYDATGLHLVLLTTNAVGYVTTNTYNTNAQLTSVSSPTGLVTTNIYDNNGLLVTNYSYAGTGGRTEYFGTNSYTYTNGLILTHTDARNLTITNSWDALMRLTNIAYPDGNISYTYSNLDLVKVVDRMGLTTSYGYNSIRQKVATTNALGHYTLYSYCLCGGLDEIVDSLGNTTTLNYDNAGRVVSKIYADGSSITNNFNSIGQITNTIDGRGASTTNWFNNQGLLLTVSNAFGQVRQVSYDIDDRITSQVDNNGVIVSMSYDNLGRTLTRTYPDGGVERLGYSPFGLVAYTNQLTNSTFYYYDAKQRKIAETNALNQITQYGYDPAGDLTNLIDQKSDSTAWGYDQYGRVTNKMDATISTILTYDYDADNRLTNRWSAQKGNTGYKYDAVGNLTNVVYPTSHALAFGYDADNRMTSMSDAVGTTSFTYTQTGQLASETGPWTNDAVAYTYVDRLRTELDLQQPNAADWIQTYVYDSANRMSGITSPAGTFNYFYNPGLAGAATSSSLVAEISLPNGAMITNTFDNNARELGTLLLNNGGSNLDSYTYTYNVGNQRTSVQRAGVGDTNTANYGYDVIGQVLSDTASEGTTNRLNEQLHYGFDPAGNLAFRTNNALIQNFAVNSLNELTSNTNGGTLTVMGTTTSKATAVTVNSTAAGVYGDAAFAAQGLGLTTNYTAIASDSYGRSATNTVTVSLSTNVTFQYDLNGNLTNDGLRSFAYDDENELIQVWVTNQWMSQFAYDAKMRRRIRQEFTWSGSSWTQTNAVYYVYDGNLVIQERGINNLPATTYARGKDLSGSLEGAGGIGGLLARTTQSYADAPMAGHAFYHSDGNGNVTCLINGSQAIVAKYLYDAFGNILSKSGLLADANLYRFSSKEVHVNSGLVYYLYRYYDPNLQRWPNRDPWREAGFGRTRKQNAVWTRPSADPRFGLDLYRFVENQPPNGRDSLGLYTISVACLAAQQAADVALQIASEDPTPENVAAAQAAVAAAYAACKEPPPPLCYAPPPPSPPPPDCWPKGDPPDGVKQYVCQEYLASCISCCEQNNPITGGGGGQAGYNQCVAACHKSYQDCLGNLGP